MLCTKAGAPVPALRGSRWKRLGVTVLAASALLASTACGTGTASAGQDPPQSSGTPAAPSGLERQLKELEASSHKHIGAFALDTGTGRTVGYRTDERFPSLSTFKAVEAAAILDKARRSDPGLLERTLHWTPDKEVPLDGSTVNGHGAAGMTVSELASAAVTASDNTAANLLIEQIGGPAGLTRYYRSLNDPVSRLDHTEPALNLWQPGEEQDTTTPAAMGRDLNQISLGSALTAQDREILNGWLRSSKTGGERIRAGLPKDWVVGDKTGTINAYAGANDIAVAWPPSHAPLVFTVYTYGQQGSTIDNKVLATVASALARELGVTS